MKNEKVEYILIGVGYNKIYDNARKRITLIQLIVLVLKMMRLSIVDYVLERGNQHFGQFAPKGEADQKSALFNNRKLLQYLFQDSQASSFNKQAQRRISDMKYEEISGQLNYFSQKLHSELSKKHLAIDSDLYKLENEWIRKKIPDFYCYYFLKFAYANTYSRMHELFLSELQNMSREKDSYLVVKKTIEAREVCLTNLRKEILSITEIQIQESIETLKAERTLRKKKKVENELQGYKKKTHQGEESDQVANKSWKNRLEIIFQLISHLRKLTAYVVQLIKNWKGAIYGITQDPRRFRQRVIFYYHDANYLLKMIFDNRFVFDSFLKKYLIFGNHYDPFFMKPIMILENKGSHLTEIQEIFLSLLKPTELQMSKMVKALVFLAEEEYDEDEQSKFIQQRKQFGQLEQRKQYIQRRRDAFASKSQNALSKPSGDPQFSADKKSDYTQKQIEQAKKEKLNEQLASNKVQISVNRMKKIQSVDLRKVSPYLNRNQRIAKAQQVLEIEHKLKVAQRQFTDAVRRQRDEKVKRIHEKPEWTGAQQDIINNKIFNKYIQQNLKLMEEANRKAYVYKNSVSPSKRQKVTQGMGYNKISFKDRKQAEYERNLEQYQRDERAHSQSEARIKHASTLSQRNLTSKGTKAIIQISNKGIRNNQSIIDYELYGRKGKNVGKILQNAQKAEEMKMIEMKLNPKKGNQSAQRAETYQSPQKEEPKNLFETEQQQQIIIMRQQPEKIEEIKQFLYAKIKQELIEEMKKSNIQKQADLNDMIEEEKRKKLQEIIQQKRIQEERSKTEAEKMRMTQLQKQRKKLDFVIKIQPIQYSEENVGTYLDKLFEISPQTYHRLYSNVKIEQKKEQLLDQFYIMFLRGFLNDEEIAYAIVKYDWRSQKSRKLVFEYVVVKNVAYFMSSFHQFCEFLWQNDPVKLVQFPLYRNAENEEGNKIIGDLQQYANRRGETFEKQLYSNITQIKYIWSRPSQYANIEFPYTKFQFGRLFNLKCQLLSSAISLNERIAPKIDMNLEVFTNYIFLLEELFRKHLTPEQVVELRENSTNIRRLKDIFRIIIQMEKSNPLVNQLTLIEGLNIQDLYEKMKEKLKPPYDKYYWHNFYDKSTSNRLLLAILEFKLDLEFPVNACQLNEKRYFRINPRRKVLTLRSSVYAKEPIYILNTNNPKIRMFLMDAENYKLMRIQLFVFLNLVFNNIVEDSEKFVHSFWFPQFVVTSEQGKEVKRITDFSISMKKSFFLSEQIYYANYEYIKNAISFIPKKSDVIFKQAVIVGFLHTDVETTSTGMPIYGKMIDKQELFKKEA